MPNDNLSGVAEILAFDQIPPTTDDKGFIICVFGTVDAPETQWRLDDDSSHTDRPMNEELYWPVGNYELTFTVAGGATPPPPQKVTVRGGLGTIVVVSYPETP